MIDHRAAALKNDQSRCGTYAGAQAHRRQGQKACPRCAKAGAEYVRAYRASKGKVTSTRVSNELLIKLLRVAPEALREEAVGELTLSLLLEWGVL